MKPINLMIIGAQKAGTTSLKSYLSQHPMLITHQQPEMIFFLDDETYSLGYEHAYHRYFPNYETGKMLLAKNVGVMYSNQAVERLYKHNPQMHLVILLRNPVDRAYSAYWFARRRGQEDLMTFEEAIEASPDRFQGDFRKGNCSYLDRSLYTKHLEVVFSLFPRSQVLIFLTDDMKKDIRGVCTQIFSSVGLDQDILLDTKREHNRSSIARSELLARILGRKSFIKKAVRKILSDRPADGIKNMINRLNEQEISIPPISSETAQRLAKYFKPHNEKLAKLIGRDLSHWNKPV
ncbi:sulfotransferase domain-containing protein [Candidatus Bathyarchaeota archaeon]|nr:sulfotransferase domain-containing protein [Candidatus Bathyarchaeota archaeon]